MTCTIREAPLHDDCDRVSIRKARRDAVGTRVAGFRGHDPARRKRQRIGWRFGRLHADDLGLQAEQVARHDAGGRYRIPCPIGT